MSFEDKYNDKYNRSPEHGGSTQRAQLPFFALKNAQDLTELEMFLLDIEYDNLVVDEDKNHKPLLRLCIGTKRKANIVCSNPNLQDQAEKLIEKNKRK